MKHFLLVTLVIITIACNSTKNTEQALNIGNYDQAITNAISKLVKNKSKKSRQNYIIILEQAFTKAVLRDNKSIDFLKSDGNDENLEKIYETYSTMQNRQNRITPLLPLQLYDEGRQANFTMENYDDAIINAKSKLTDHLYTKSINKLETAQGKGDYRSTYNDLIYLNKINPEYKDVPERIKEAQHKGTDFVNVVMKNSTEMVIPNRLEEDLLNFDTYGINKLWTTYHGFPQPNATYDYEMEVTFLQINISPEKITERQLEQEKIVNDGWKYVTDSDGNELLDKEGNKIKKDITKKVRCEYYEFTQYKSVNIQGNVRYRDLKTRELLDTFPLSSEFVFEHIYANYNGDKRALSDDLGRFLGIQSVPFPSNEQMIYDTGEDLKNRLKGIIGQQWFQQ